MNAVCRRSTGGDAAPCGRCRRKRTTGGRRRRRAGWADVYHCRRRRAPVGAKFKRCTADRVPQATAIQGAWSPISIMASSRHRPSAGWCNLCGSCQASPESARKTGPASSAGFSPSLAISRSTISTSRSIRSRASLDRRASSLNRLASSLTCRSARAAATCSSASARLMRTRGRSGAAITTPEEASGATWGEPEGEVPPRDRTPEFHAARAMGGR